MPTPKEKLLTEIERDERARREAVGEYAFTMAAKDAFANKLRPVLRKITGVKDIIANFHRGLWNEFSIRGEHEEGGCGLHIGVRARIQREDGKEPEVRYTLSVSGASDLTERETRALIMHLLTFRKGQTR
jgi:hypothetical protein